MFDDQTEFHERFDWGEDGIRRLVPGSDVVVVVDVLSFSTAVDVAVARGATVYPYRWRDARAAAFAARISGVLASHRTADGQSIPYSLAPSSLLSIPAGTHLVLPSPNGATLTLLAAELGATVLTGCLRNASAVAAGCRAHGGTVLVVAAGERWRQAVDQPGSLRPAVEDLVGAGAILSALVPSRPSPEVIAAIEAFHAATADLGRFIATCASGRELRERGLSQDLALAAQLDVSRTVPHFINEAFEARSS